MTNYPAPRLVDLGNPVDTAHPLNRDLAGWWLGLPNLAGGYRVHDITRPDGAFNFSFDNVARWRGTRGSPTGFASFGTLTASSWTLTGTGLGAQTRFNPTTAVTVAGWAYIVDTGDRAIFAKGQTDFGALQYSLVASNSGGAKFNVQTNTTTSDTNTGTGYWSTFQWVHLCGTWEPTTGSQIYINGVLLATAASAGGSTLATGTGFPIIGSTNSGGSQMRGTIADIRLYANRRLKPDDVWALYDESRRGYPTALRRYTPAVWSFAVPVPLVHYTLTADTGAFALAGVATGLLTARLTSAGVGSFALAGTAADVRASRVIDSEVGAFVLAGTDATLSKNSPLAADVGAFALAGTDADLRATRTLTADTGAFALAGTAAGLVVSRVVTAEAGTFALAGTDAGLRTARTLPVTVGAFALSGTDAGARVARVCAASAGAFSLAGVDAGLRAARLTSTETGAFALTGIDATLSTGRPLAADVGAFALAGQPVGLSRTRRLTAATGEFAIAGANVTLTYTAIPLSRFGIPGRGAANATATGRVGGNTVAGRASGSFTSDGRTGGSAAGGRGSGNHAIGGDGDNDT